MSDETRPGPDIAHALASRVRGLSLPRPVTRKFESVPAEVLAAVRRALDQGDTHYTSRPGIPELRAALVARLAAVGLPVGNAETDVVVTAGREEALFVIALSLRAGRATIDADGLDARAREVLRLVDVGVSDTGEPAGDATRVRVIDLGSRLFTADEPRLASPTSGVWTAFGDLDGVPGLASFRVGFAAGDRSVMAGVRTWKQAFSICTAAPSQRAALAAIALAEDRR